jgi:NitT/TauT family transport system ATP-binding protein
MRVAEPHVRLAGVSKVFMAGEPPAPLHAAGPIDLELERGEFFAVVGPSGCGKSTLLELIAGLTSRPRARSSSKDGRSRARRRRAWGRVPGRRLAAVARRRGERAFGLRRVRLPREEKDKR